MHIYTEYVSTSSPTCSTPSPDVPGLEGRHAIIGGGGGDEHTKTHLKTPSQPSQLAQTLLNTSVDGVRPTSVG